jgi:uncharacterized iron-regulated membrane protein
MLPLFIVSITGSILVFKVELDTWLRPQHMSVDVSPDASRVALDQMIASLDTAFPNYGVAGWELFDDKRRSDAAYLVKYNTHDWYKVYLNQYTGEILSEPVGMSHYLTDWLLELHYAFLLDANGMFVGALVSLMLLFLGISGIVLYRHFWTSLFRLRFKHARRIMFSDLHKLIGINSSPVLIILAFTGAYWNILMVAHEIEHHVIDEPVAFTAPLYEPHTVSVQQIVARSQRDLPGFTPTYLLIPSEPELEFMVFGFAPDSGFLQSEYSSVLTYAKSDGALLNILDIREAHLGAVIDDSFRKLHFGYFGGLTTKIIWCVLR